MRVHPWHIWLKETREMRGLTAKHCAEVSKISASQWSKWEAGAVTRNVETLRRVAIALQVPVEEVFEKAGIDVADAKALLLGEFERRMLDERESKEKVGLAAAKTIFEIENKRLLANDGTSIIYCMSPFLEQWADRRSGDGLELHTNNTQLVDEVRQAAEAALFRQRSLMVDLTLAPGRFDVRDRATTGRHTIAWFRGTAPSCTCILATTGLDAQTLGPFARGEESARIKLAMMKEAPFLIVLASASKLASSAAELGSPDRSIYREMASAWRYRLQQRETLYVISDLHPEVAELLDEGVSGTGDNVLPAALQQELENARFLRSKLGNQFVIAGTAPSSARTAKQ